MKALGDNLITDQHFMARDYAEAVRLTFRFLKKKKKSFFPSLNLFWPSTIDEFWTLCAGIGFYGGVAGFDEKRCFLLCHVV